MARRFHGSRLPLVALADVVHFPRTELRLHVAEPASRQLVRDVVAREEEDRWIGVVLQKPSQGLASQGRPEVFAGGTASRLLDAEIFPDGCSNIVLHGEVRFRVQRELADALYRQAVVEPVEEPWLNDRDPGIVAVRSHICALLQQLAAELGESFPFGEGELFELSGTIAFEELVNRIAADLDVPALRKQALLQEGLPDRGMSVLAILRSRQQVLDHLRPFRHLAQGHRFN
jgi:Lon protease-like protein